LQCAFFYYFGLNGTGTDSCILKKGLNVVSRKEHLAIYFWISMLQMNPGSHDLSFIPGTMNF